MNQTAFGETKEEPKQIPSLKYPFPIRRLSVVEYHKMGEIGMLGEDERVELIDGVLKEMSPIGTKHSAAVRRLAAQFYRLVLEGLALLCVQDPIVLTDDTEPEPDLTLVKPRDDAYAEAHPRPDDVLLLIEVSETTLEEDRTIKLPRYAATGISEVWIVNLVENRIEVYLKPRHFADGIGIYQTRSDFIVGDTLTPQAFSNLNIAVSEVLC